ncbi:MAG: acylneuraminate cytidylyltransferase family protein [Myxococcota bacterium]
MKNIALIPARGGSKRIPYKNLAELAGKPLLAWTIEAALDAWTVDAVFVSTEDKLIAHTARRFGAEVIERPPELAMDTTGTEPVMLHALEWLKTTCSIEPDHLILLQCTSPLRGPEVINRAVQTCLDTGCDSIVGVHPTIDYFFSGELQDDRFVISYDPQNRPRTQEIPPRYRENGSTYVVATDFLKRTGCRMGGDMRAVVMTPTEGLDIDDLNDLALAQMHMERLGGFVPHDHHTLSLTG